MTDAKAQARKNVIDNAKKSIVIKTYERGKVLKTFRCDPDELLWGTLEDVFALAEAGQHLAENGADDQVAQTKELLAIYDRIVLMAFYDMTPEDLKLTKISERTGIIQKLSQYAAIALGGGGQGN